MTTASMIGGLLFPRHCERSEAIQLPRRMTKAGLLRRACNLIAQSRNDDLGSILSCSRFDSGSDLCEEKNLQARRFAPRNDGDLLFEN